LGALLVLRLEPAALPDAVLLLAQPVHLAAPVLGLTLERLVAVDLALQDRQVPSPSSKKRFQKRGDYKPSRAETLARPLLSNNFDFEGRAAWNRRATRI
jgi:hypothetical protein